MLPLVEGAVLVYPLCLSNVKQSRGEAFGPSLDLREDNAAITMVGVCFLTDLPLLFTQ